MKRREGERREKEKKRGRRKKKKRKKSKDMELGMESTYVWIMYGILTLQYMCILIGLS